MALEQPLEKRKFHNGNVWTAGFLWGFFRNTFNIEGLSWMTIQYQDKTRQEESIRSLAILWQKNRQPP